MLSNRSRAFRWAVILTAANYLVQAVLLAFFPLNAPCHWNQAGAANGWMNKYLYLLLFALPFFILWALFRKPRNMAVAFFYQTPLGHGARILVWVFSVLVTWIPAYAILFVPHFVQEQNRAAWISGMVYGVELSVEGGLLLLVVACAVSWVRAKIRLKRML